MLVRELILFSLVGILGFIVDVGILYQLKDSIGNYWGRAVSFIGAVLVTWILNRNFTFSQLESGMPPYREFSRYFWLMLAGGMVNYATYAIMLSAIEAVAKQPALGVATGSIAGMAVNFITAKLLVFRKNS